MPSPDKASHECPFCGGTMEPKAGVVSIDALLSDEAVSAAFEVGEHFVDDRSKTTLENDLATTRAEIAEAIRVASTGERDAT